MEMMRQHDVGGAYEALVPLLDGNEKAQSLFLELLRTGANLFFLNDYAEEMEADAKAGKPYMQYAFARWHDCTQPEAHSNATAEEYYLKADEAGIADAHMCLAYCWRDGDLGLIDKRKYCTFRNEAVNKGSHMAAQQQLRDIMYGQYGYNRDPWGAYTMLDKFIRDTEKAGDRIDPRYLTVLAAAAQEKGANAEADLLYEKALKGGDVTAWFWLMRLRCYDQEGNLADTDLLNQMIEEGCDLNIGEAFGATQLYVEAFDYDSLDEEIKTDVTKMLKDSLKAAWELGDQMGTFNMGSNYYLGHLGFEQDYELAWQWFARAALMRCNAAYTMMAKMIEEGTAPKDYSEEFQHICELRAYRLGDDDCLEKVIDAYKHGFLTDYAMEIERYHLPDYESRQQELEEDDDEYDEGDDGRYDAYA